MDWGDSYFTMSEENNYTIWRLMKTCHERGWLYRGHDVMPWCPRCGTGISHMEIETEGYRRSATPACTYACRCSTVPNESLLVWTTTPWTLTSNVAAAVNPELPMCASNDGQSVWLAEALAKPLLGDVGRSSSTCAAPRCSSGAIAGPFDELPAQRGVEHRVIPWADVTQEEGTGIVHIAPGCGEEDFRLWQGIQAQSHRATRRKRGLRRWLRLADRPTRRRRRAADRRQPARRRACSSAPSTTRHRYPHCWRCGTELVFRLVDEWYIRMDDLRHLVMDVTRQIRWIPDFGLERELDWLRNMRDWMISKKRYWGLALPIWFCDDCQQFEVVGGIDELRERAVAGWSNSRAIRRTGPLLTLSSCRARGAASRCSRIPDVGNPWLDAGIVPFSTMHYRTTRPTGSAGSRPTSSPRASLGSTATGSTRCWS